MRGQESKKSFAATFASPGQVNGSRPAGIAERSVAASSLTQRESLGDRKDQADRLA